MPPPTVNSPNQCSPHTLLIPYIGTPNYPTAEVFAVPMYGIRRVWGEHWFGEFTVGGGISYHNLYGWDLNFKPHIQYRVGFVF